MVLCRKKQADKYRASSQELETANYENVHQTVSTIMCDDTNIQQQPNGDNGKMCDTEFEETAEVSPDMSHNHIDGMNTYTGLVVYQNTGANDILHRDDAYQSLK